MLISQVGPSHPGRQRHLKRPSWLGTQSAPFRHGLAEEQMSVISEQSRPANPVLNTRVHGEIMENDTGRDILL